MPISFLSLSRIFKWSCILCLIWQTWSKPAVQQDGFQAKYSPQSGRNNLDIGALISELLGLDSDFYFRRLTSKLPHRQKATIRTPGGLFLPNQGHSKVYMKDCLQSNPASVSWTHIAQGWSPSVLAFRLFWCHCSLVLKVSKIRSWRYLHLHKAVQKHWTWCSLTHTTAEIVTRLFKRKQDVSLQRIPLNSTSRQSSLGREIKREILWHL